MNNFLLYFVLAQLSFGILACSPLKINTEAKAVTVSAKIIDGESGQNMVGQMVVDVNDHRNRVLTDVDGLFELTFQGEVAIVELPQCFSYLFFMVDIDSLNQIFTIDRQAFRRSKRIAKKLGLEDEYKTE